MLSQNKESNQERESNYPADEDNADIEDRTEEDDIIVPVRYDISSYGVDFDVEGLCRRLRREEIYIPAFQRNYVWNIREASRFIESLLLGLPVPGIFLARDDESGKLLVIDGQQRLKSLLFFSEGFFDPRNEGRQREFKLVDVQGEFAGRSYSNLDERNRIDLDNSIIHATVVMQEYPHGDDTSIYHIFERLNSAGRRLNPQEMRSALYPGYLMNTIQELNHYESWRNIFGRPNTRLRDEELILRFLALNYSVEKYTRPLKEFLTKFLIQHRNPDTEILESYSRTFMKVADLWWRALGRDAFRPSTSLNAAVFDSAFVGLARRLEKSEEPNPEDLANAYNNVLLDQDYREAIMTRSTSEEASVSVRLEKAISHIAEA